MWMGTSRMVTTSRRMRISFPRISLLRILLASVSPMLMIFLLPTPIIIVLGNEMVVPIERSTCETEMARLKVDRCVVLDPKYRVYLLYNSILSTDVVQTSIDFIFSIQDRPLLEKDQGVNYLDNLFFGLGFNSHQGMAGADVVILYKQDGGWIIEDRNAIDQNLDTKPVKDRIENYELLRVEEGDKKPLEFRIRRQLETCDVAGDQIFKPHFWNQYCLWAIGVMLPYTTRARQGFENFPGSYHMENRGSARCMFFRTETIDSSMEEVIPGYSERVDLKIYDNRSSGSSTSGNVKNITNKVTVASSGEHFYAWSFFDIRKLFNIATNAVVPDMSTNALNGQNTRFVIGYNVLVDQASLVHSVKLYRCDKRLRTTERLFDGNGGAGGMGSSSSSSNSSTSSSASEISTHLAWQYPQATAITAPPTFYYAHDSNGDSRTRGLISSTPCYQNLTFSWTKSDGDGVSALPGVLEFGRYEDFLALEVHYYNPELKILGKQDQTGIRLHYLPDTGTNGAVTTASGSSSSPSSTGSSSGGTSSGSSSSGSTSGGTSSGSSSSVSSGTTSVSSSGGSMSGTTSGSSTGSGTMSGSSSSNSGSSSSSGSTGTNAGGSSRLLTERKDGKIVEEIDEFGDSKLDANSSIQSRAGRVSGSESARNLQQQVEKRPSTYISTVNIGPTFFEGIKSSAYNWRTIRSSFCPSECLDDHLENIENTIVGIHYRGQSNVRRMRLGISREKFSVFSAGNPDRNHQFMSFPDRFHPGFDPWYRIWNSKFRKFEDGLILQCEFDMSEKPTGGMFYSGELHNNSPSSSFTSSFRVSDSKSDASTTSSTDRDSSTTSSTDWDSCFAGVTISPSYSTEKLTKYNECSFPLLETDDDLTMRTVIKLVKAYSAEFCDQNCDQLFTEGVYKKKLLINGDFWQNQKKLSFNGAFNISANTEGVIKSRNERVSDMFNLCSTCAVDYCSTTNPLYKDCMRSAAIIGCDSCAFYDVNNECDALVYLGYCPEEVKKIYNPQAGLNKNALDRDLVNAKISSFVQLFLDREEGRICNKWCGIGKHDKTLYYCKQSGKLSFGPDPLSFISPYGSSCNKAGRSENLDQCNTHLQCDFGHYCADASYSFPRSTSKGETVYRSNFCAQCPRCCRVGDGVNNVCPEACGCNKGVKPTQCQRDATKIFCGEVSTNSGSPSSFSTTKKILSYPSCGEKQLNALPPHGCPGICPSSISLTSSSEMLLSSGNTISIVNPAYEHLAYYTYDENAQTCFPCLNYDDEFQNRMKVLLNENLLPADGWTPADIQKLKLFQPYTCDKVFLLREFLKSIKKLDIKDYHINSTCAFTLRELNCHVNTAFYDRLKARQTGDMPIKVLENLQRHYKGKDKVFELIEREANYLLTKQAESNGNIVIEKFSDDFLWVGEFEGVYLFDFAQGGSSASDGTTIATPGDASSTTSGPSGNTMGAINNAASASTASNSGSSLLSGLQSDTELIDNFKSIFREGLSDSLVFETAMVAPLVTQTFEPKDIVLKSLTIATSEGRLSLEKEGGRRILTDTKSINNPIASVEHPLINSKTSYPLSQMTSSQMTSYQLSQMNSISRIKRSIVKKIVEDGNESLQGQKLQQRRKLLQHQQRPTTIMFGISYDISTTNTSVLEQLAPFVTSIPFSEVLTRYTRAKLKQKNEELQEKGSASDYSLASFILHSAQPLILINARNQSTTSDISHGYRRYGYRKLEMIGTEEVSWFLVVLLLVQIIYV